MSRRSDQPPTRSEPADAVARRATDLGPSSSSSSALVRPEMSYQFSSHDRKMISMFEIIVAYFVGVYFNDIYNVARASLSRNSGGKSLTDMYKSQVQAFVIGAKNDETCYRGLINNLYKYFAAYYSTVSFPQFVDKVMEQIVPSEYFGQLSNTERDEFLSSVVCELVTGLAAFSTTSGMLQRIIDAHDHQWKVTQRMIQDHGVTVLLSKRETLHNLFLKKIGQAKDQVPMGLVDDMKKVLRRLVKEKLEERERADRYARMVRALREREVKFQKIIALLKSGGAAGPSAALQEHLMPRSDTLAEVDDDPLDHDRRGKDGREDRHRKQKRIPEEDKLAEPRDRDRDRDRRDRRRHSDSDDGSDDRDEDDSEDESDESGSDGSEDERHQPRRSDRGDRDRDDRRDRHGRHDRHDRHDRHSRHDRDRRAKDRPNSDFFKPTTSSSIVVTAGPKSSSAAVDRDISAATSAMAEMTRGKPAAKPAASASAQLFPSANNGGGGPFAAATAGDDDGEPISLLAATTNK